MNLGNNSLNQNINKPSLQGINNNSLPSAINQNSSVNNAGNYNMVNDSIKLQGLKVSSQTQVNFNQIGNEETIDSIIAKLNTIPDPNERSAQMRDFFATLVDNDNFAGAAKVINATPSIIYRNAMFKGLVQELVAAGSINTATHLINNYDDARIQSEMRQYTANYLNFTQYDSSSAAKVMGDSSLMNIASLKAKALLGTVGDFVSNIGHSISSLWSSSSRADSVARAAENIIGKQYRLKSLDYGNLACAYAVTQVIKQVSGLENLGSSECNTLASQLSKNGFKKAYGSGYSPIKGYVDYKPGDIVFFTRSGKKGYGHVGVVSEVKNGVPYMVHNSSSNRAVVKVRLDQYYKTPVAVYRAS